MTRKQLFMKRSLSLALLFFLAIVTHGQLNPVTWNFTAVKLDEKTYEVHMKASIQSGWHLYSQKQPGNAIAIPTTFTINKNPIFSLDGKVKEIGKLEVMDDKELNLSANQYSGSVDFVQKIKLKSKIKTNFNGSVEYQTCDDKKCLPPKKVNFSISIK